MNFDQKRFAENEKPPKKLTQKEEYNNIEIKNKENTRKKKLKKKPKKNQV